MRARFLSVVAGLAVVALSGCGGGAGTAAPATGTPADEQQIRAMATAYATAFTTHDVKPVAAILADDYEDVTPQGVHEQGAKAVTDQMAKDMAMVPTGMQMSATTTYIRWLSDKAAVAGGTYTMGNAMPGMPSKGAWMGVVVKKDSTWKMVASLAGDDDSEMMMAAAAAAAKKPK